jgi:hypothetical protein
VPRYTESELRAVVASSLTLTEVLRKLGLRPAGGNHAQLRKYLELWQIPTDHFDPDAVRRVGLGQAAKPLADILVEHSTYSRKNLKERLYAEGLKRRECELCGQDEIWNGKRISLILDHINGVADDHRLENLRIACPNCAAGFDTHCARNNARPRLQRECARCGERFWPRSAQQRYCGRECGQRSPGRCLPRPQARKVIRPPYEQLAAELAASNYSAVGRKYGVSDNAVRKWLRAYERERERDDVEPPR